MRNYIVFIFVFLSLTVFGQGTKLTTSEFNAFKQKVEKETQSLTSIRTDFVQSKHLAFLSNDIESKGKMFLKSDGTLKWEYSSPNQYSVIFKYNTILINDNGKKSNVSGGSEVFKKISHLISGSVSGKLFNDKEFDVVCFKEGEDIVDHLTPTNNTLKKYIKKVYLYFPKNETTVSKVRLIEPSDDYTSITFINKELNVKIDPNIFNN